MYRQQRHCGFRAGSRHRQYGCARRHQVRWIGDTELPRSILAPPFKQLVRVDAVLQRQFRYRDLRITRRRCQLALEFDRAIRTTLPRRPTHPCCRQSSPHYLFGGHHSGSSCDPTEDGLHMTLTTPKTNDEITRSDRTDQRERASRGICRPRHPLARHCHRPCGHVITELDLSLAARPPKDDVHLCFGGLVSLS